MLRSRSRSALKAEMHTLKRIHRLEPDDLALPKSPTQRKSNSQKSAAKSKPGNKTGKLPEWNLADLYSGIDAPEVASDLQKMDADCVAFETDYKGKLAEHVAKDDG